jgi:hypothetical protein
MIHGLCIDLRSRVRTRHSVMALCNLSEGRKIYNSTEKPSDSPKYSFIHSFVLLINIRACMGVNSFPLNNLDSCSLYDFWHLKNCNSKLLEASLSWKMHHILPKCIRIISCWALYWINIVRSKLKKTKKQTASFSVVLTHSLPKEICIYMYVGFTVRHLYVRFTARFNFRQV